MQDNNLSGIGLVRALSAHPLLIFVCAFVTASVTAVASFDSDPTFMSTARVLVNDPDPRDIGSVRYSSRFDPNFIGTRLGVITSHRVATEALSLLAGSSPADDGELPEFMYEYGSIEQIFDRLVSEGILGDDATPDNEQDVALALVENLSVSNEEGSRIIEISAHSTEPEFASAMANAFVQGFVNVTSEFDRSPLRRSAKLLESRVIEIQKNLSDAQETLVQYQSDNGIVDNGNTRNDIELSYIASLSTQLVEAKAAVAASKGRVSNLDSALRRGVPADSIPDVSSNRLIQELKINISLREGELYDVSSEYGVKHPVYLSISNKLQELRNNLKRELDAVLESQRNQYEVARLREKAIDVELTNERERLLGLRVQHNELPFLKNEVEQTQKAYDAVLEEKQRLELLGQNQNAQVIVLSVANLPTRPTGLSFARLIALGFAAGLMLGALLAVMRELFDGRINSIADVEELMPDLTFVAQMDSPAR